MDSAQRTKDIMLVTERDVGPNTARVYLKYSGLCHTFMTKNM